MNQHCAASVTSGPGQRKSRLLPWLLLVLLVLLGAAACTDLQVALRQVDR